MRSKKTTTSQTKAPLITGFPPNERPGPDFWLKSKYASRFYRDGAAVPYEVVKVTLRAGMPVIHLRVLKIQSNNGRVKVKSFPLDDFAAPIITARPDKDYSYRKYGGVVDRRGNRYNLTDRPLMAVGTQFIDLGNPKSRKPRR